MISKGFEIDTKEGRKHFRKGVFVPSDVVELHKLKEKGLVTGEVKTKESEDND